MIADILTVAQKEFKEILAMRGRNRNGLVSLLIVLGIFGILFPLQNGPGFIQSPISATFWAWIAYISITGVVADSFAGERERHTLETLLATRLSDSAILLGKLTATVMYGVGMALVSALTGMITVSVSSGAIITYPAMTAIAIVGGALLAGFLAAGLGINVSLRATSVRQAGQTMSILMFVVLAPLMLLPVLPQSWVLKVMNLLESLDITTIILIGGGLVLAFDIALILIAMRRFKRARLILD